MKNCFLAMLPLLISSNLLASDWVSDWVNQAGVGAGASTYKGGNRTYMSAGNLSLRANGSTDYPFTISAPRIETSGCGIDLFGGGLSYMDADFLVEKFEGIIQNAEVVAFQLGVQALSDKLGSIITDMEDVTNFINSMQLNDCAIAKSAVTTIVDGGSMSNAGNAVWKEISQGQTLDLGIFKNSTDSSESIQSHDGLMDTSVNIYQEIAACPKPVKNIFDTGSVIDHLTSMYGLGSYEDLIRGYIGDVFIITPSGTNIPIGITKGSCPQNT
ncbi:MAG: conjugal transfer protein TraH [Alteromonadaceae bacterium]|nr:conjugal transfer protein TraH [Alteromonadaceae bacterium]